MNQEIHSDDIAVDNFANAIKEKLKVSREKGRSGWDDKSLCTDELLCEMLIGHLFKGNKGTFEDIATFAMMLHQREADPEILENIANKYFINNLK